LGARQTGATLKIAWSQKLYQLGRMHAGTHQHAGHDLLVRMEMKLFLRVKEIVLCQNNNGVATIGYVHYQLSHLIY
jgi:hypothetical protein